MTRRAPGMAVAASLLAVGIVGLVVLTTVLGAWSFNGGWQVAADDLWSMPTRLLAASAGVVVWLLGASRPASALSVAAVGLGLELPDLAGWLALPPVVRTMGLAATPLVVAGATGIALDRPSSAWVRRPGLTAVVAALAAVGLHILGYDPFLDPGCRATCDQVNAPLANVLGGRVAMGAYAAAVTLAAGLLLAVAAGSHARRPFRLMVAGAAVAFAAGQAARFARWTAGDAATLERPLTLLAGGLVVVAASWELARGARLRREMASAVALAADPTAPVRAWAGRIQIAEADYADVAEVDVPPPGPYRETRVVELRSSRGTYARLLLDRGVDVDEALSVVTPLQRFVLENHHLSVLSRRRLETVRQVQRRTVELSDAERRRIERDLHDGAQQRLLGVSMYLELARRRAEGTVATTIAGCQELISAALEAIRGLAHAAYPMALDEAGLQAALREWSQTAPVAVSLDVETDQDLPEETLLAAFTAVTSIIEALAAVTHPTGVSVTARRSADRLRVTVTGEDCADGSSDPELTHAADRVGAVGGTMTATSSGEPCRVTMDLPCAS